MITYTENVFFCVVFTLLCYLSGLWLYIKYQKSWLNPLYTSSVLLILLLVSGHIREDSYQEGSHIFNQLLQLAVVLLAVPLYKQWMFLKTNYKKILMGVFTGTAMGVISAGVLASIFHLKHQLVASLIPKSVTLPIALIISSDLGGLTSTTVFFVVLSALISLTIGPHLFKGLEIKSKAAKGLAMDTSA
ncbi:LrgB family protein [Neobacillus terrae]|uniref:LrgB family protein n=1 Tax=Neobacillus terrae TaxID=3034837 RepID=UPI001FB0ED4A|nr:LrgB family protein [Neobacillus terrae]